MQARRQSPDQTVLSLSVSPSICLNTRQVSLRQDERTPCDPQRGFRDVTSLYSIQEVLQAQGLGQRDLRQKDHFLRPQFAQRQRKVLLMAPQAKRLERRALLSTNGCPAATITATPIDPPLSLVALAVALGALEVNVSGIILPICMRMT